MRRPSLVPAALVLLTALGAAAPAPAAPARRFVRGMALGLYANDPGMLKPMLREIKETGAEYVSFVVSWHQQNIWSAGPEPNPKSTISDQLVVDLIKEAHRLGMRVFLFPIVDVEDRKIGEWRGTLKPPNLEEWFRRYDKFILHYASLAAKHRVDLFSVGSELIAFEGMRQRWVGIIERVRRLYPGPLIYSANWDHYKPVTFWDRLDYVGLTGYYQLAEKPNAPLETLRASWRKVREELVPWAKTVGRPVVFTEIGYTSQVGTATHPWDYTRPDPVDLEEQYRCYRAVYDVWRGEKWLGGIFFWNWFGAGGPKDNYYTPKGKPAERVIREWYQGHGSKKTGVASTAGR
ncbi:MAG TPA: hypothetical protein VGQ83_38090 [Polyangia bacterium]